MHIMTDTHTHIQTHIYTDTHIHIHTNKLGRVKLTGVKRPHDKWGGRWGRLGSAKNQLESLTICAVPECQEEAKDEGFHCHLGFCRGCSLVFLFLGNSFRNIYGKQIPALVYKLEKLVMQINESERMYKHIIIIMQTRTHLQSHTQS